MSVTPSCLLVLITAVAMFAVACPTLPDDAADTRRDRSEGEGEGEGGDVAVGGECTLNVDCQAVLRCGCDEGLCLCEAGVRGVGRNGVDTCVDENDCATALCVEGTGGPFFCSGPCDSDDDCGAGLPLCADIAFVGRICVRLP